VRIVLLALAFLNGFGVMLYLALWLLVPNEDSAVVDAREQVRENVGEMQSAAHSVVQRVRGMFNS
jgi:phage shock protein C